MALRSNNRARALAVACAAVGFIAASGAVQAQNVSWTVTSVVPVAPINFCKAVVSKTARDAVRICLSKVAINLPITDFAGDRHPGLQVEVEGRVGQRDRLRLRQLARASPHSRLPLKK